MKIKKIIFLILLTAIVLTVPGPEDLRILAGKTESVLTLAVDAGHGGPDGGAEASDGTQEAGLNLAIAKALKKEAEKRGIQVVMTRETEDGLYAVENTGKKWRKLEDLQQRKAIIDAARADAAVTIHMNCFKTDPSVRGAQVFYPKSGNAEILETSQALAETVQKALVKGLNDGSNRIQMGRGEVYLMENPQIPMILVECGFLSNAEDLARLKQEQWQQKIAVCILDGIQTAMEI